MIAMMFLSVFQLSAFADVTVESVVDVLSELHDPDWSVLVTSESDQEKVKLVLLSLSRDTVNAELGPVMNAYLRNRAITEIGRFTKIDEDPEVQNLFRDLVARSPESRDDQKLFLSALNGIRYANWYEGGVELTKNFDVSLNEDLALEILRTVDYINSNRESDIHPQPIDSRSIREYAAKIRDAQERDSPAGERFVASVQETQFALFLALFKGFLLMGFIAVGIYYISRGTIRTK